jgi:hypothetical protein
MIAAQMTRLRWNKRRSPASPGLHLPEAIVRRARLTALLMILATGAAYGATGQTEQPYLAAVKTAMDGMMAGMMVPATGNVDGDFVAMMTPHHQGAIDMAVAELRYGKNEQLKRIAQEIIVDQQQEIAAMKLAIGQPLPPSMPAPTQGSMPPMHMEHQQ